MPTKLLNILSLKGYGFLIATVFTILVNGLGSSGIIGDSSVKEISDKFFTILTPAPYTFSIWSLIYLSLLVIGILIATKKIKISDIGLGYYFLSSLTNCVWIVLWQLLLPGFSALFLLVLVVLNCLVYLDLKKSNSNNLEQNNLHIGVTSAYLVYLGWTIVASLINFTVMFKYVLNYDGNPYDSGLWGIFGLSLALVIISLISVRQKNPTAALVLLWATVGISVEQENSLLLNGIRTIYGLLIVVIILSINEYFSHKQRLIMDPL